MVIDMKTIANTYMMRIADAKEVETKYDLIQDLRAEITEFEVMNDMRFMRSTYSRTNTRENYIETYEMIFFSDMFSLLIKKDYNNGELIDCAVMEYYNEDEVY